MAYHIEKGTNDIVINGFEQGISDDPYAGISDLRNVNLISIPKEASVNFATALNSNPAIIGATITSADSGADTITTTGMSNFISGNAVYFTGGSLPTGLSANTVYWLIFVSTGVYQVFTDFYTSSLVNITGSGTGTINVYNMGQPKYFTSDVNNSVYMLDANGLCWTTQNTPSSWVFMGNTGGTAGGKHGNGLVYYQTLARMGYLFVFDDSEISYIEILAGGNTTGGWQYGWDPELGSNGHTGYLKNTTASASHEVVVGPDNKVYYCDTNYIGRWYQASPSTAFNPLGVVGTNYIFDETAVLPFVDNAQCLAFLGNTLLIGGTKNIIYPWDTFSQLPAYPIFVAENNIQKMVTVNISTFALVGNRGRVYVTSGSSAGLFKKIPDHLSGTVEPYFTWGGLTSVKNQIYFSASVKKNNGDVITAYGGVWAVDVDTKAIRLTNKLSYGTYAGYATALIPNFSTNPAGTGLYIGWDNGTSTYGVDKTIATPYTGGETIIASDLIPIGTVLKPTTNGRVEFKLAIPLVDGESVKLQYRQKFSDSFADIDPNISFNTAGVYSGAYQNVPFENSQWIQIQAVLTSTATQSATSPSFVRLTEIRLGS